MTPAAPPRPRPAVAATKHLYSNGCDTYVATSVAEAYALYSQRVDGDEGDDDEIKEWSQDADDSTYSYTATCGRDGRMWDKITLPDGVEITEPQSGEKLLTATCGAWATVNPIGFFATTEF